MEMISCFRVLLSTFILDRLLKVAAVFMGQHIVHEHICVRVVAVSSFSSNKRCHSIASPS